MHKRSHYIYPDKDSLVAAFVCEFEGFLQQAASSDRPLHLALSGGATPLTIFSHLKEVTTRDQWSNIHLYWGDERCVPPGDPESNYGLARERLLDPLKLAEGFVHPIRGEEDPQTESVRYGQLLHELLPVELGIPVFDWIWLGLGEDGHTASIFPHQIELMKSEGPCAVAQHPESGQKRITVTGMVINAARRVSFIVSGKRKSNVINEIVMKEGNYMNYPAFYVAPYSGIVEWYMDQDVTSWLQEGDS